MERSVWAFPPRRLSEREASRESLRQAVGPGKQKSLAGNTFHTPGLNRFFWQCKPDDLQAFMNFGGYFPDI